MASRLLVSWSRRAPTFHSFLKYRIRRAGEGCQGRRGDHAAHVQGRAGERGESYETRAAARGRTLAARMGISGLMANWSLAWASRRAASTVAASAARAKIKPR